MPFPLASAVWYGVFGVSGFEVDVSRLLEWKCPVIGPRHVIATPTEKTASSAHY